MNRQSGIHLGEWLPDRRGIPKIISNAAVFRILPKGAERKRLWKEPLSVRTRGGIPEYDISMTGIELDQYDCDVWLELCHIANQSKECVITIRLRDLLRRIGKKGSGSNMGLLRESLARLQHAQLTVRRKPELQVTNAGKLAVKHEENDSSYYVSSLILRFGNGSDGLMVQIDTNLSDLFCGHVSHISHGLRLSMKTDLAKFLLNFFAGDRARDTHHVSVVNLHAMSGSRSRLDNFPRMLQRALKELTDVGVVARWKFLHKRTVLEYTTTGSAAKGGTGWYHRDVQKCLHTKGRGVAAYVAEKLYDAA